LLAKKAFCFEQTCKQYQIIIKDVASVKILITGNMGYVGPSVVSRLRTAYPDAELIGLDIGFFAHCLTHANLLPETCLSRQIFADVRNITAEVLKDVYAVVHLAGISNDPMGNTFEKVTDKINCQASIQLAQFAKEMGAKRFIFASSCSVYGFSDDGPRKENDGLNPLTAYARSKIGAEKGIADLANENFVVTCLRFATACGMSDRLRLDLVVNDFVASAIASKKIEILSDGTPWRPLIHVKDMARAIDWSLSRDANNGGAFLAVNTGSDEWNYQVKDLAEAVARVIPGIEIFINKDAAPDKRSYKVDFAKFRELAPDYQPQVDLENAVCGLRDGLEAMKFDNADFRNSNFMRIQVLTGFRERHQIDENLKWNWD
jgi:nucleoside-diphosphate-sugar epimerase